MIVRELVDVILNMNNQGILSLQLFLMSQTFGLAYDVTCWEGHRLYFPGPHTGFVCIPCEDGTFMAETHHRNRNCNKCSEKISHLEVVITACNRTHDTEIQCVSGYYRTKAQTALENDMCVKCRKCESGFPARPCLGYNDTVCCPLQHDAGWTCEGKYDYQERPTACGAGMYYNTYFDRCLSCSHGTYMQIHNHTARECPKCEALSGNSSNHAVILQNCTRISPTVFGCEDFHFRASNSGSLLVEAPCRPCQKCSRYLRQCQILHDAICADDNSTEDRGDGQKTDVPESIQVAPPTQTSSYEKNIQWVDDMLLYLLYSCMRIVTRDVMRDAMRVVMRDIMLVVMCCSTLCQGFPLQRILREISRLYRVYYLSLFIVVILFRMLIFLY